MERGSVRFMSWRAVQGLRPVVSASARKRRDLPMPGSPSTTRETGRPRSFVLHKYARARCEASRARASGGHGKRPLHGILDCRSVLVWRSMTCAQTPATIQARKSPSDRAARREVPRQHSPLAAGLQQVEDRVHHPPQAGRSPSTARPRRREQRRDQRPFPVRHVACIAPARAHIVAPGGRRPRHPIPRRLLPETTVIRPTAAAQPLSPSRTGPQGAEEMEYTGGQDLLPRWR